MVVCWREREAKSRREAGRRLEIKSKKTEEDGRSEGGVDEGWMWFEYVKNEGLIGGFTFALYLLIFFKSLLSRILWFSLELRVTSWQYHVQ